MPLLVARLLLLAAIVAGILFGLWAPEHSRKILVSLMFGVCIGVLWRYSWRRTKAQSPEIAQQVRRNVAQAQEMLRDSFSWRLGSRRPAVAAGAATGIEDVLSDVISIVLAVCLAAMVWLLPVFWALPSTGLVQLAKSAGAHFFALCCVAAATFGVITRIGRWMARAL